MIISIAAVAKNNVIGKDNTLPWNIPEDLKHFRKLTSGKTVLMGRKTYESIFKKLGKPLPNRTNLVITRNLNYEAAEGVFVYTSLDAALDAHSEEDIYIIGGAEIYRLTMDRADVLEITHIDTEYEGDTFFPEIDPNIWKITNEEKHAGYRFTRYERN